MPDDYSVEDPIADVIIEGSTYEALRLRRPMLFKQPVSTRLAWQGGLLLLLAAILPIAATYSAPVRSLFDVAHPVLASPRIVVLGAAGGGAEALAALALVGVVLRRRCGPPLSERECHRLLAVEEVASLFGVLVGGFAILLTVGTLLLGHVDAVALAAVVSEGGRSPLSPSGTGMTVRTVAAWAFAAAVALLALSRWLASR